MYIMKKLPVVDARYPFTYASGNVPPTYRCTQCGKTHVKLWRTYCCIAIATDLLCPECLREKFKTPNFKPVLFLNEQGNYCWKKNEQETFHTDQIGTYVPAVPTEENDTFWGYTSVPQEGVEWWRNLNNM